MNWYLKALRNYVGFSGRARRTEYWMFFLINMLVSVALVFVDRAFGTLSESGIGTLGLIYSLALLLPSLAVGVRRLHDRDKSGWWLLLGLLPLIGGIILLVWFVIDGDVGDNRFGPDPKAGERGLPVAA